MSASDRIAVSSWSLHRLLGIVHPHDLDSARVGDAQEMYGPPRIALLDLPALAAVHGVRRLEICSFHIPSRGRGWLGEMRAALAQAGVVLQTILIEAGDLSDPATAHRDAAWISGWVETAAELGAANARIIAGKQKPTDAALALAADRLLWIADRTQGSGVALVTENWFDLLPAPRQVLDLLDRTDGRIGLNGDFGNWSGPRKYDDLAAIFGRASLCHAKAAFDRGRMDDCDFGACIDAAEAAGYTGPYTLIFDADDPDEWAGIEMERDFVLSRLAQRAGSSAGPLL